MGTATAVSAGRPRLPALARKAPAITGLTSTPSTLAPCSASGTLICPVPQPRSSTSAPGRTAATPITADVTAPRLADPCWSQLLTRRDQTRRCLLAAPRVASAASCETDRDGRGCALLSSPLLMSIDAG